MADFTIRLQWAETAVLSRRTPFFLHKLAQFPVLLLKPPSLEHNPNFFQICEMAGFTLRGYS